MKNKVLLGVGILIMMGLSGCARANAAAQEETQKNKAYHKIIIHLWYETISLIA